MEASEKSKSVGSKQLGRETKSGAEGLGTLERERKSKNGARKVKREREK